MLLNLLLACLLLQTGLRACNTPAHPSKFSSGIDAHCCIALYRLQLATRRLRIPVSAEHTLPSR